jgi:hypothetical protein
MIPYRVLVLRYEVASSVIAWAVRKWSKGSCWCIGNPASVVRRAMPTPSLVKPSRRTVDDFRESTCGLPKRTFTAISHNDTILDIFRRVRNHLLAAPPSWSRRPATKARYGSRRNFTSAPRMTASTSAGRRSKLGMIRIFWQRRPGGGAVVPPATVVRPRRALDHGNVPAAGP